MNNYEKLNEEIGKELPKLKTTEMFYFTAGQVARHILKRAPGQHYNKVNPLLAAETSGELKEKMLTAFKSNNNIEQNERFERALAIVLGWKQDDPMDEETFIFGYTTESVF